MDILNCYFSYILICQFLYIVSSRLQEGKQTQDIFIGVHQRLQAFSTVRLEFKTKRDYQRSGLLLSIRENNVDYALLFLHLRSGDTTEDFGLRDAAISSAFNMKTALDDITHPNPPNFIFLGDLNTMGIDDPVPYSRVLDLLECSPIILLINGS